MSYEGYYQKVCANGHQWAVDAYGDDPSPTCPICHKPPIWSNPVDLTNGSFDEDTGARIDGYIELDVVKQTCCPTCGEPLETIYALPTEGK